MVFVTVTSAPHPTAEVKVVISNNVRIFFIYFVCLFPKIMQS